MTLIVVGYILNKNACMNNKISGINIVYTIQISIPAYIYISVLATIYLPTAIFLLMHIELQSENSSVTWQEIVTEKTSIIFGPNALFMNWYWHHLIQSVFSSAWASDALVSMFLKLRLLNFTSQCCLSYLTLCGIYLMDNVHIFKINAWIWHLSFAVFSYHW